MAAGQLGQASVLSQAVGATSIWNQGRSLARSRCVSMGLLTGSSPVQGPWQGGTVPGIPVGGGFGAAAGDLHPADEDEEGFEEVEMNLLDHGRTHVVSSEMFSSAPQPSPQMLVEAQRVLVDNGRIVRCSACTQLDSSPPVSVSVV